MATQINSNYSPLYYRAQAASMAPLSRTTSTQATQSSLSSSYTSSTQSTQTTQTTAQSKTLMQSLKGLNLSQDQLNKMVTYGRIAGGAGVAGVILGLIFPPVHFLVALGAISAIGGLAASVISDALGGKG